MTLKVQAYGVEVGEVAKKSHKFHMHLHPYIVGIVCVYDYFISITKAICANYV